jgi:hypothetical protein
MTEEEKAARLAQALGPEELEALAVAVGMRRCWIESGTVTMTAAEAERAGRKVKALEPGQMRTILELEDMRTLLLRASSKARMAQAGPGSFVTADARRPPSSPR